MIHLGAEQEVRDLLDIPEDVSQAGLTPVAYFEGEDFRRGTRRPLEEVVFYSTAGGDDPGRETGSPIYHHHSKRSDGHGVRGTARGVIARFGTDSHVTHGSCITIRNKGTDYDT